MGKKAKVGQRKKIIRPNDARLKEPHKPIELKPKQKKEKVEDVIHGSTPSRMFFNYNPSLGPPYQILLDTNFIAYSFASRIDIFKNTMDCLLAKCVLCVTDCVLGEMEKQGVKSRLGLAFANDPRIKRLTCTHKGTYADDCLVERVSQHKCYIVGTNDGDLKRRIRKIPGVPIMFVGKGKYGVERMPDSVVKLPTKI